MKSNNFLQFTPPKLASCHRIPICIWRCHTIKSIIFIEYFSEICKYGIFKSEFLCNLIQLCTVWVATVVEQKWYSLLLSCQVWCNLKTWSVSQYTLFLYGVRLFIKVVHMNKFWSENFVTHDIISPTIFWSHLSSITCAPKIVNNFMLIIES